MEGLTMELLDSLKSCVCELEALKIKMPTVYGMRGGKTVAVEAEFKNIGLDLAIAKINNIIQIEEVLTMGKKVYFKILPTCTRYIGIDFKAEHQYLGLASAGRDGKIMLDTVHNTGITTDLPFNWDEVEQLPYKKSA